MKTTGEIIRSAFEQGLLVPAFNIPHLPMMEPVIQAVADQDSFALIETARLEWYKFAAKGPDAVMAEFQKFQQPKHVRMHLDHVPVIDEDGVHVDFLPVIQQCIDLGYQSVMLDGSRLKLDDNIAATRKVADLAHKSGVVCEAELGAVLGHEAGPLPPYEELFASGKGFTDVGEAKRFVEESACDWLSVAVGNIHGAISGVQMDQKKVEARLQLDHLDALRQATGIPLVLHGGTGVKREYVLAAVKRGITKINIGTEIRQAYDTGLREGGTVVAAQQSCYDRTSWLIKEYFELAGTSKLLIG